MTKILRILSRDGTVLIMTVPILILGQARIRLGGGFRKGRNEEQLTNAAVTNLVAIQPTSRSIAGPRALDISTDLCIGFRIRF